VDPKPYLDRLAEIGRGARERVEFADAVADWPALETRVAAINEYLFDDLEFTASADTYDDPRNSYLNEVLDRRIGTPVSLGLVYLEVARAAGLFIEALTLSGHFLLRCRDISSAHPSTLVLDPADGTVVRGTDVELTRPGSIHEPAVDVFGGRPATKQQVLVRLLIDLKHAYVGMRSFPQARSVTELLLALDPSAWAELRDRGLLAYHLHDFPAALRDLEKYLRLVADQHVDEQGREDHEQIWEHVKTLRRRVAALN
jgi:regulator of sirC expression with transglutaminase-like and TPR domain